MMDMLMTVLENNRGYVLANATLIKLIYKLVTGSAVVQDFECKQSDRSVGTRIPSLQHRSARAVSHEVSPVLPAQHLPNST